MKVLKGILNTIVNIMIVVVLVVSILIAVMALTSKASGISTIFGYTVQIVQTDSMKGGSDEYPGGDFSTGDIIIGKATNSDRDAEYQVGDIITYYGRLSGTEEEALITHRIIDKGFLGETDKIVYRTKGDNGYDADQADGDTFHYVPASDVKSVFYSEDYHGVMIKNLGNVLNFVQSQSGFFLVVLLPMIIFFVYAIIRVVISGVNYRNEKAKEEMEETEEERQAAIDAAVAEALKKQAAQDSLDDPSTASHDAPESPAQENGVPQMSAEELEQFRQFQAFKKMQEQTKKEQTENTEN